MVIKDFFFFGFMFNGVGVGEYFFIMIVNVNRCLFCWIKFNVGFIYFNKYGFM